MNINGVNGKEYTIYKPTRVENVSLGNTNLSGW